MAAVPGSSGGPTVERIVGEAFRTAALIILEARVPSGPRKAPPTGEARPWVRRGGWGWAAGRDSTPANTPAQQ